MSLCLNMIVRNEADKIERALASAAPYISSWVIADTGSNDGTQQKIRKFFSDAAIPGNLYACTFEDFGQARNKALYHARNHVPDYRPKFFLLMDADMELVVKDAPAFLEDRNGLAYEMYQHAGATHYTNARLLSAIPTDGWYKGPTHEYLDVPTAGCIPESVAHFVDHADGSNRTEKFKRDIRLLKKALETDKTNARYMYYLAASYADAGDHVNAAKWFRKRIDAGGWDQEVWQAEVRLAHAYKELGLKAEFIATLFSAYARRPTRAESMYDLAKWFREQPNMQAAALACAEAVEHLPGTTDNLFANDFVYKVGVKEEISISAAYVPGKGEKGRRVTDQLSIMTTPYWTARAGARANTFWYLKTLGQECPSFRWQKIPFTPPDDLVPMNPSVTVYNQKLFVNVRAVNYRIDDEGRYIIKATDGTANRENPIDTRNFILNLGFDPFGEPYQAEECYRPGNMACEFDLVTGFEDLRLFSSEYDLWGSATVRQLAADGQCEQVLTKIVHNGAGWQHTNVKRMLRTPRETEKNWSPIVWSSLHTGEPAPLFLWRPGIVVNSNGEKVVENPPPFETDNISGSSQLIPWGDGWLSITHTAHPLPNKDYKRYYHHRFIEYGRDMRVVRMSLPFVFNERVIEFCAGMCWHPEKPAAELVISYGFLDNEARIATISATEVGAFLGRGHVYG